MKPVAAWDLVGAAALGTLLGVGPAGAQTPPPTPKDLDAQTPAAGAEAPAYQDRVLEGLPPEEDLSPRYDPKGWRRFLRWDLSLGSSRFKRDAPARWGTAFYGQLETPSHGSLSAEGQANLDGHGGHFTLRQRAFPLSGGWYANHELGVVNALTPSLLRLTSRVYLPTPLLRGASGEWLRGDGGLAWQLSAGQPGWLGAFPDTGFIARPGHRARAAMQWDGSSESDSGWSLATQHEVARGVASEFAGSGAALMDADSNLIALRHAGANLRWQGQWMGSREPGRSRQGVWLDAEWDDLPRQWAAGLYRLDPGLRWAGMAMSSDAEGGYLRLNWHQRRWSVNGSLDLLRSLESHREWGYYGTVAARWRLARDSSLGAGAAWRDLGSGQAGSAYLDWRFSNAQGPAGLRLSRSTGLGQPPTSELSYDQEWRMPPGWSLETSLGVLSEGRNERDGTPADTALKTSVGLSGDWGRTLGTRLQFDAEHGRGGRQSTSLSLNASWRFSPRWSLEGSYLRATGRQREAVSLDPLVVTQPIAALSDRSFLVLLRYQFEAGSRSVPLGGRAGSGGGSVSGVVFFDANRNGLQEASEAGVPNATVYLDNRYAMRTDSQGRFEFPSVAPGPRSLSLRSETLPLPWSVVDKGIARVDVQLRETSQVLLPVQRPD